MRRHHLDLYPDADAILANRLRRIPLGKTLVPDDIGRVVLYLSCVDSTRITGTSIVVDGGYMAAAEWENH